MKLRCPRCQKKLSIPDKYAGKTIRCPACQKPFAVPKLTAGVGTQLESAKLDLEGLASLERATSEMGEEELAQAQAQVDAQRAADAQAAGKNVRVCPNCGKPTQIDDPHAEVLCSHCWQTIPALIKGETLARGRAGVGGPGAFYGELAGCIAYPVPALSSLATAAGIAIAAALVPVVVMTALHYVMAQGNVGLAGAENIKTDLSGVQWILVAIFGLEIAFYAAVALHVFLDVIRASVIGNKAPPTLGWSPASWSKSVAGYFVLLVYYAVATSLVLLLTYPEGSDALIEEIKKGQVIPVLKKAGTPFAVGMLIISLGVPMNLLGFGLGTVVQAMNPVRVFKSIARTHVHYLFLVLLLCVYGILFASAFLAIVFDWFIPKVQTMVAGAAAGEIVQVALALVAWGVVMAFYFFGNYVLARLHGIFALSFRKELEFGTL